MKKILKNRIFQIFLFIALTVIVLYFILKDDFNTIMTELFQMNPWWVVLAFLIVLLSYFFRAIATNIITRQIKPDFKVIENFELNMATQFFNSITPLALGGHPMQLYMLNKKGISLTDGTNIITQNFIAYQIAIVMIQLVTTTTAFATNLFGNNLLVQLLVVAGLLGDIGIVAGLLFVALSKKVKYSVVNFVIKFLYKIKVVKNLDETLADWNSKIELFNENSAILLNNKKKFIQSILANFVGLLLLYSIPLLILYATGNFTDFNLFESIYVTSCVVMLSEVIPTPGRMGGAEYGFSSLFSKFVSSTRLSAILIVWRFVTYYLIIIVGAITFNINQRNTLGKKEEATPSNIE